MKALSLRQPWAWLVVNGHKDIENRTWPLPVTLALPARVYIHAGKSFDDSIRGLDAAWIMERLSTPAVEAMAAAQFDRGTIVVEVTIYACVRSARSRWFVGPYGYLLRDVKAYDVAIPYTGHLGFFNISDEDIIAARKAQVWALVDHHQPHADPVERQHRPHNPHPCNHLLYHPYTSPCDLLTLFQFT